MKKVSGAILIVLMALLVSCSMDTEDPSSRMSYVTFGQSQSVGSRSLDTSYDVVGYDELYWFYDAVKKDTYGTTGAGTGQKIPGDASGKGTAGTVGPFSQGEWEFKLYAYSSASDETGSWVAKSDSLVYASEAIKVSLRGGETKNIAVSVTPRGDTGTVAFENEDGKKYAYFKWNDGGTDAPVVTFHLDGSKDANDFTTEVALEKEKESSVEYKLVGPLAVTISEVSTTAIPVDFYNCTVTVSIPGYEDTPLYTQSFSLSVFGGQTTIITGDITENVDSEVSFDVMDSELVVFQSSGRASSSVTPSGNEGATTTVDFSSANLDSGSTYYLTVGAAGSSAQNNDGFVVSEGEYVVGSIDLSLIAVSVENGTTVQIPVTSFDGDAVTVTTYIEAGLPEVSLQYVGEGDDPTLISYDSTTGELKFSTTHFSTFIVVADAVAMNMDTGMCYGALNTAFNEAGNGDSIKLLADVVVGDASIKDTSYIIINNKTLSFDLAGHRITPAKDYYRKNGVIYLQNEAYLTIEDSVGTGLIDMSTDSKYPGTDYAAIYAAVALMPEGGYSSSLTVNGGTIAGQYYAIAGNGSSELGKTTITINGGTLISEDGPSIYHPQRGVLTVNDGTLTATDSAIELRSGKLVINGGTFTATASPASTTPNGNGTTTKGAAIAIAQHTTKFPIDVVINGGTFNGFHALYQKNVESNPQEAVDKISIEVNGGDFSTQGKGTVPVYSENITGFINAGTFSDQIDSKYVAVTSELAESGEVWVVTPIFEGSGSESDPYQIGSVDQLKKLAEIVNAGTSFQDEYFILTSDLDLANENWTPIGLSKVLDKDPYSLTKSSFNGFAGTFDGQNRTISNLMINRDSNPTIWAGSYLGLFGVVDPGATLKDFTINNVDITGNSFLGAAVGYCPNDADFPVGTVKLSGIDVTGKVNIEGESNMGALLGRVETKVESVITDCHISAEEGSGISSSPKTWVSNFAGGLAGSLYSTTSNVIKDVSVANLTVEGDVEGVGALCGHINHGTVSDVAISNVTAQIVSGRSTGNDRKSIGAIAGLIGGSESDSGKELLTIDGTNSFENVVLKFPIAEFSPYCHGLVGTYRADGIDDQDPSSSVTGATSYEGISFHIR